MLPPYLLSHHFLSSKGHPWPPSDSLPVNVQLAACLMLRAAPYRHLTCIPCSLRSSHQKETSWHPSWKGCQKTNSCWGLGMYWRQPPQGRGERGFPALLPGCQNAQQLLPPQADPLPDHWLSCAVPLSILSGWGEGVSPHHKSRVLSTNIASFAKAVSLSGPYQSAMGRI